MIDTSDFRFAKPRPKLLEKRERAAALRAEDARQRKLCHLRSGGRCEVVIATFTPEKSEITYERCKRPARQNHHLISGRGRRNVDKSILAAHRLDICNWCHTEVTNHLLTPIQMDQALEAKTVRYERRT